MERIKPENSVREFRDIDALFSYMHALYDQEVYALQKAFKNYCEKGSLEKPARGFYPYIELTTTQPGLNVKELSFGFLRLPNTYRTTLTRPRLFERYYRYQIKHLLTNHDVPIRVGLSDEVIPIHFAFPHGLEVSKSFTTKQYAGMGAYFDLPDLAAIDDRVIDGKGPFLEEENMPLSFFSAVRTDYSLHRLQHYTGSIAEHFQGFILFTNYQFYMDEFLRYGKSLMEKTSDPKKLEKSSQYRYLVLPGNEIIYNQNLLDGADKKAPFPEKLAQLAQNPQMPAYHLVRTDGLGITMINMGVGPSNAKTITDHLAVLRPHAWLMLGHCAGLRHSQHLGDYVLAHGYVRRDHVLDDKLPIGTPLPPLSEIQIALEEAVAAFTGQNGLELKKIMRTGTVVTVDNRNWETNDFQKLREFFSQNRAIALDMESATIAANGFRNRVPYGALLCVSDKPLHGELKLAGMANQFYQEQVEKHLEIGIRAIHIMRARGVGNLHSRKLRSFAEPAFQ